MRMCFLLERGVPPRLNPVIAETCVLLEGRGVQVTALYPEEEVVRLDTLAVAADLYLLKSNTELALSLATAIERLGGRVLNRCSGARLAASKVLSAAALLQAGIATPRSLVAGQPAQVAAELAAGPLILKPHGGHYGRGITVVDSPAALPPADAYPHLVFAQRFLARARTDLKVFGIGDEVFGLRKSFSPDSFLQAGELSPLSPSVEGMARRCGHAFGLDLYGLDFAEDEDGGEYIVDVNSFPGYRGVPDAARRLAEHIMKAAGTR